MTENAHPRRNDWLALVGAEKLRFGFATVNEDESGRYSPGRYALTLPPLRDATVTRFRLSLLAALLAGCASAQQTPDSPVMSEPLAAFASVRMVMLPVQYLRNDSLGWATRAGDPKRFLAAVDTALEKEFRDRGLGTTWVFPPDLVRTARRNPMYATDPVAIRAGDAARVMERRKDAVIPEPVATQLRTLVGFHDARHALVPVEFRFDPEPGTGARAVLHVVVLDVRGSRIAFSADIAGEVASDFSPALATGLARRFADLIVAR